MVDDLCKLSFSCVVGCLANMFTRLRIFEELFLEMKHGVFGSGVSQIRRCRFAVTKTLARQAADGGMEINDRQPRTVQAQFAPGVNSHCRSL